MRALQRDFLFRPQPLYSIQVLFKALSAVFLLHTEGLEFDIAVPDPAPKDEFAVGHNIQCAELFRHIQRLVERQQHNTGVETQARRLRGHTTQKWHLLQIL